MKLVGFAAIVMVVVLSGNAQATVQGINVLSQQYHINGWLNGDLVIPGDASGRVSYDVSDVVPVSRQYSGILNNGPDQTEVYSDAGLFSLRAMDHDVDTYRARAWAEGTWTFSPSAGNLVMEVSGSKTLGTGAWSLTDLTTGNTLVNRGIDNNYHWTSAGSLIEPAIVFDVTHQYGVHAALDSGNIDNGGDVTWSARFIPEPATLLLFSAGTCLFRRFRR